MWIMKIAQDNKELNLRWTNVRWTEWNIYWLVLEGITIGVFTDILLHKPSELTIYRLNKPLWKMIYANPVATVLHNPKILRANWNRGYGTILITISSNYYHINVNLWHKYNTQGSLHKISMHFGDNFYLNVNK